MKIFNWVHRKFNNKDELAESARKNVSSVQVDDDNHKKFLFENCNATFCNVFDEWKGGILSIGTFGYDPLIKEENAGVYFYDEKEELVGNESDIYSDNEDEVNPLIYAAYTHDYEGLVEMKMGEKRGSDFEFCSMIKNTNKARTTLAQLFSADSGEKEDDVKGGELIKDHQKYSNNDNNKHAAGSISFAKKLLLIGDQDHAHRPIHKFNRLMRRMMKRKIHPADIGLNCKYNPINSVSNINNLEPKKYCQNTTESASLLPTQDTSV